MGNISIWELLIVFAVVLLVFGAKRIPEVARSLGRATREFKNARDGVIEEIRNAEPAAKPAAPAAKAATADADAAPAADQSKPDAR